MIHKINKGIPTDSRYVDEYLKTLETDRGLLIQWLEDFKSKFGDSPIAQPTIDEIEDAFKLYDVVIGGSMAKVKVEKARDARKADGSVLEYGLAWQLERFNGAVTRLFQHF